MRNLDYFVAYTDKRFQDKAIEITAGLRKSGLAGDFSYKTVGLGKQLKQASMANAKNCIIIGDEFTESNALVVKDMSTGRQKLINVDEFFSQLNP